MGKRKRMATKRRDIILTLDWEELRIPLPGLLFGLEQQFQRAIFSIP